MCRWCVRYRKVKRLAEAVEEAYGPKDSDRPGNRVRGKKLPDPASESDQTA